jgi:hypothetical protein
MTPENEAVAAESAVAVKTRKRAARRAAPVAEGEAPPVARIMQLVAALKAEHELPPPEKAAEDADAPEKANERLRLMQWLRRLLTTRNEERGAWESRVRELAAQLEEAQRVAAMASTAVEEATTQHERLIADLKLMHEHQRSIWQLERRQLEITLDALQKAQQRALLRRISRPALAAALLLVSLAAVALTADSHPLAARSQLYLDDGARAAVIVMGRG